ncbi:MAG TPA: NAD-dependent epimerase/dehydratase family protein, partial [Pyrinomonadaceae bacterium]|nr:NAD-dependent epimerase/dehydratase family protein [Pyrinomonadaceae bacterium]
MPKTPPKKRTAQIVPKKSTKKHAAIVKKVPPTTLITGGTGFLGSHLVRQLVESGAKDIRVMATSIPEWLTGLGVDTVEGSVTNADDVARACESVNEIYHLAGKVSREKDEQREMYKLHVDGTRLLCDAASKAGV